MRAALDADGGHAPHEGLRVLTRLGVGWRHGQEPTSQRQPLGLGRQRQQPEVADALEAWRQHMQQQSADELPAVNRDGTFATAAIGTQAQSHVVAFDGHPPFVADGRG